jgi:hypothetical protein
MNTHESEILGVKDANGLASLRDAVVAMVAAEEQRSRDRAESDSLRAQIRVNDERWKSDTAGRLDRVQASQEHMAADLATLHTEVGNLPTVLDGKLTAAALAAKTEETAERLELKRKLDAIELATAPLVRKGADGVVVRKFLSAGMRMALSIVACVLFVGLSIAMFAQRMDLVGDAAGVLAAIAAVVAIVYGNRKQ